jgi:hypothetical protein
VIGLVLQDIDERADVAAGDVADLAHGVRAQFEGDGHNVLEDDLGRVDEGEVVDLGGDRVADPPFAGVALKHEEHVD